MSMSDRPQLPPVIGRLRRAWNARDQAAVLACFHPDYNCVHPLHPERNAWGLDGPRLAWGALLDAMPDFRAELLRWAQAGDEVWSEWRWTGSPRDGGTFTAGGVMIFGLVDDHIAWARLYTETIAIQGPDFDRILEEVLGKA